MDEGNLIKCVAVGDAAVGKTCLLISYTTNTFPAEYVPTVFDNYETQIPINNEPYTLQLWDTAGSEHFDVLRPLSYAGTHVFVVCYSVTDEQSFINVDTKWIPDIRTKGDKGVPIVIVGNKIDDEGKFFPINGQKTVEAHRRKLKEMAEKNKVQDYFQVSALTQSGLTDVFEAAVRHGYTRITTMGTDADEKVDSRQACVCSIM